MKLTCELVPKTCWYSNVRSNVSASKWKKISQKTFLKANYTCEICGTCKNTGSTKHGMEAHEIWEYTIEGDVRKQKLIRIQCLCKKCHMCKHPGLARIQGKLMVVLYHMMKINNINSNEVEKYLENVFLQWEYRSKFNWELDISWLNH